MVTKLKNRSNNRWGFGAFSDTPLGINIRVCESKRKISQFKYSPLLEASLQTIKVKVSILGNIYGNIYFLISRFYSSSTSTVVVNFENKIKLLVTYDMVPLGLNYRGGSYKSAFS